MSNRIYGPSTNGKMYMAVSYHQKKARKNNKKSRWFVSEQEQFNIFNLSDVHELYFPEDDTLIGLQNNCSDKIGCDDERLAKFIEPSEGSKEWHGYPVFSIEFNFTESFLNKLESLNIIDRTTRNRLVRGQL